ncbi:sporulation domain-containing protein [Sulfuricella denitrificans skB26]|uniref:Sporulation domain-containing protein n=1 Tax=Sulfuricella denitrificans (strain DSM 22764 / NBRC 105220 / skB26) TaxID=1163617 RepID=S6ABI4_SULDS|nr:SPOR domain-containing protein [Sulfuricella denitrificans]BAN34728.1 sporulation domain-containing protein [Sulfuricella denitrificans skB26]
MANQYAMSDEEVQLRRRARRRLIGAVTLVTVMVIALPMVLDGESRQSGQDIAINIPSPGSSGDFVSRTAPVQPTPAPASPHPQPEKAVQAPVSAETQTPHVAPPVPPVKDTESAKAAAAASVELVPAVKEPAPQSKHKDEKSAVVTSKQEVVPFEIQLGAFANLANAKERQSRLAELKIKFYTETVKTPSGDKLRVRAGPYATRQEAERVQAKLKAAGIRDGVVAEKKG